MWSIPHISIARGTVSALVLNLCLFLLPVAAASLFNTLARPDVFGYPAVEPALSDTRRNIEQAAETLMPRGVDRRRGWEELVARELREGDPHAARGFVLSARTLVGGGQSARLLRNLGDNPTDARIAAAMASLLSNETRDTFSEAAGWMAASDASQDPAAFLAFDANREMAQQAEAWLAGRDADHLSLVLTGVRAAMSDDVSPRVALGASALKDARRAGRLGRVLSDQLEAMARAAAPPERLNSALRLAIIDPASLSDGGATIAAAFRASVDAEAFADLAVTLRDIGDMAAATSSRGAGRLLAQARDLNDLPRLRLVAQAGGDRAVAVAKRLTTGRALADAAQGTTTWTRGLIANIAALASLGFGMIIVALVMFASQIRRLIRRWEDRRA